MDNSLFSFPQQTTAQTDATDNSNQPCWYQEATLLGFFLYMEARLKLSSLPKRFHTKNQYHVILMTLQCQEKRASDHPASKLWLPVQTSTNHTMKVNSLTLGIFKRNFRKIIFQLILVIDGWSISCKIVLKWMPTNGPYWWYINIGSGNGLVPSGNKPLPEPMLTQISVAIWCH